MIVLITSFIVFIGGAPYEQSFYVAEYTTLSDCNTQKGKFVYSIDDYLEKLPTLKKSISIMVVDSGCYNTAEAK